MESMFGVPATSEPKAPISWAETSSAMISTKFGTASAIENPAASRKNKTANFIVF